MRNERSLDIINHSRFSTSFLKPAYDTYCFSKIPQTITNLLTGEQENGLPGDVLGGFPQEYDRVILFFIDAFGWQFLERFSKQHPFLERFIADSLLTKLTAQFPSTTAAHVTTIHTGLPVGESGVYEWYYYEPLLDAIIAPLLFSFAGTSQRNTLHSSGIKPDQLYPGQTLHTRLKNRGITSYVYQPAEFTPSPYSDIVLQGARVHPYKTLSEAFEQLTGAIVAEQNKGYFFFYYARIDSICHWFGPNSLEFEAEVAVFLDMLERMFLAKLAGKTGKTLFLMTADHGQVAISPKTTRYLNSEFPALNSYIRTNHASQLLVPGGSSRDMFLYIKDDLIEEAKTYLQQNLAGVAEVYLVRDLIEQQFFGPGAPSATFLGRVGNVVILPFEHESVWWYEKDKYEQKFLGNHGGLTAGEMEIPFLVHPF